MIDILFLSYNRLEFTSHALMAMLQNTEWSRVSKLYLYDDGSTDGTLQTLQAFARRKSSVPVAVITTDYKSPVASMNHFLKTERPTPIFAKIDNDVILPPEWLSESLGVMDRNPDVDLLGIEAHHNPTGGRLQRKPVDAPYIGGIGLMRTKAFQGPLPTPDGRMGFTRWQDERKDLKKAWISPALPVVLLNRMTGEPWDSLNAVYVEKGWQRAWPGPYKREEAQLWEWWMP